MDRYSNLGEEEVQAEPDLQEDSGVGPFTEMEMEEGLDGARFSYLFNFFGIPFCLIPLMRRDNPYSLFHARQAFLLWGLFYGTMIVGWLFSWITLQAFWIFVLGGGVSLACNVLGYQRVMEERSEPLPVIGDLAERWFGELSKPPADPEDS